jgi:hypothetical protein
MRFQKTILYLLLATMAVGCEQIGGFNGCNGCFGFNGCKQWDLSDDHFLKHQSGLPFCMFFSAQGAENFGPYGPSANGTTNSSAIAGIGIQHFLSTNLAFRVLVNFSSATEGPDSAEIKRNTYGLGVGLLHYFRSLYNIAPYAGIGLGYNTSSGPSFTGQDVNTPGQNPQGSASFADKTINTFGVTAVAGFDWYLTQNIAIGSEYALGFSSSGGTQKNPITDEDVDLPSSTTFGFAPAGNLHVLIHF